jgi:hypothetical protein
MYEWAQKGAAASGTPFARNVSAMSPRGGQ